MSDNFIPAPVFIMRESLTITGRDTSQVRCPRCREQWVHLSLCNVRISSAGDEYPKGGGGFRGEFIAIPFWCEHCDSEAPHHGFWVYLQFHKGEVFIWADVVQPIDGPETSPA